jgi:hypothetical protein
MELYGGTPMHPECYDKLGAEMNSLDDPPQDTISEDELEYAYQSHYGFGHAK